MAVLKYKNNNKWEELKLGSPLDEFPVGSIYCSPYTYFIRESGTTSCLTFLSPASLFGGSWEQMYMSYLRSTNNYVKEEVFLALQIPGINQAAIVPISFNDNNYSYLGYTTANSIGNYGYGNVYRNELFLPKQINKNGNFSYELNQCGFGYFCWQRIA